MYRWFNGNGAELVISKFDSKVLIEIDQGFEVAGCAMFFVQSLSDISSLIDTLRVIEAEIRKEVCGNGADGEG